MNMLESLLPQRWLAVLTGTTVLLVLANLLGLIAKFHGGVPADDTWVALFDLDQERNVPSVFSTGLILASAGWMYRIARAERGPNAVGWWGLAVIFVFLAADELVSLHERLIEPLRATLHTGGVLYFAWLIPYGLAVSFLGLLYLRFLLRLPAVTRVRFLAAAAVYLGGAVGLELLGGAYLEQLDGQHNLPYELLTTLEESLEMAGMILMLRALCLHGAPCADPAERRTPYAGHGHKAARPKAMASKGAARTSSSSL